MGRSAIDDIAAAGYAVLVVVGLCATATVLVHVGGRGLRIAIIPLVTMTALCFVVRIAADEAKFAVEEWNAEAVSAMLSTAVAKDCGALLAADECTASLLLATLYSNFTAPQNAVRACSRAAIYQTMKVELPSALAGVERSPPETAALVDTKARATAAQL